MKAIWGAALNTIYIGEEPLVRRLPCRFDSCAVAMWMLNNPTRIDDTVISGKTISDAWPKCAL